MNNIRDKYVSWVSAIRWVEKKNIYRDTGEVLSIPPMSGIFLTPKSVHTVKAPACVILTVYRSRCSFRRFVPSDIVVAAGSHNLFRSLLGWLSTPKSLTGLFSAGRVD